MSLVSYATINIINIVLLSAFAIRQKLTHKKDDASHQFLNLLFVSILFCVNDCIWGLISAGKLRWGSSAFFLFSTTFHWLSGFTAWVWFRYIKLYSHKKETISLGKYLFWLIPLGVLTVLLIVNFFTPTVFHITTESGQLVYNTEKGRIIPFLLEIFYFVLGLIDTIIHSIKEKDDIKQKRYITVMIFAILPILTGILQYQLPDFPAYSIGFMFSCITIFLFNTTAENEIFSIMMHEQKNLEKISSYEQQLKNAFENEIYHEMLQKLGAGVIAVNMDNDIVFINDAAARMYGFKNAASFTATTDELILKSDSACAEGILGKLREMKKTGGHLSFEISTRHNGYKTRNILVETHVVDVFGNKRLAIFCLADITNNKMLEKELLHLSETDPLTGLSNRRSGEQRTELLLLSNKAGMFCILDADHFKTINDTYGHSVGDKVLVAISQCLKKAFRGLDIIMRMGGDEFSVFAVNIDTKEKAKICLDRLVEEIKNTQVPELKGSSFSVSIGAVLCYPEAGKSLDEYFKLADSVLYKSKEIRNNHYEFCDYEMPALPAAAFSIGTPEEVEDL